ncbi:MAG: ABC transporter ATP-binding protein [Clostridia bacterium]|nr:ABC transporter ATP-binding protein [Clostridia bacterium]
MKQKNSTQNRETGRFNRQMLFSFLRGCRAFFVISIAASVLASLCELVIPKIISYTIDVGLGDVPFYVPAPFAWAENFLGSLGTARALALFAGLILAIAVLMGCCKYLENVFNRKGAETLVENMRNRLYEHIGRLPFAWYMKNQTGDIIQRCTSDVETVKAFLSEQLTSVVSTTLLIGMSLGFMFGINTTLACIALVSIPIVIAYSAFFHGKIGARFQYCDENEGKLSSIVQENLTGVRVVRAFGREKYEVDKFTVQNNVYCDAWVKLSRLMSLFWAAGDLISGLQVMIILVVGAVLCVDGSLTTGDFIAIVSYNSMLTWPVRSLGRVISEMSKTGVSIGRIGEIMAAEAEQDVSGAVDADMDGDIVFDHVSFGYDESAKILHDVSLEIKKGSTVGILGMTGSGKSTLVSLLCRLYDLPEDGGKITLAGRDIREIKASSLRKNIGIVLQEPFLFSRTLRENIGMTFDDVGANEAAITEAARAACLDETIRNFTNGYETTVGERGVTLSGGQKQRTAIARLLASAPPVMIFDDSLSAVDSETDAKIRAALREKTADSTVILISHRIQTLMSADKIVVMAGGRITESGTHEELLRAGGIYKKINDIQTGLPEEIAQERG